jgi:DNA excision repair protein ERCC-2
MPPRFEEAGLTVHLSVGDLLDASMVRSIGFANRGGFERLWLGQAIHSRYQESALEADPSYRQEVPIKVSYPHRGWTAVIRGRIDGLRHDSGGKQIVEEIKSVRRGGSLAPPIADLYARQAGLYAWMLQYLGKSEVQAELILVEIGSENVERVPVEVNFQVLEAIVKRRLNSIIRGFEADQSAAATRRAAAQNLSFPHSAVRPGQGEIISTVEESLEQGSHLLLEAPTGIGKTVAALYPALRYALEHDKKIYVLTAKTLQQEMATAVLSLLNQDKAFSSLRLRAKAKMCANAEVICHEEYCPYARDYYSKLRRSQILQRLVEESGTLLPDRIFESAQEEEVCPFEVSLELGSHAKVVVCDYNYAFDPYVALDGFGDDGDLENTILIIDEIHNLIPRGRGYYSPSLSSSSCLQTAEALGARGEPIHLAIAALCRALAEVIDRVAAGALEEAGGDVRATEALFPEDELWALRSDFDDAFIDYLEYRRDTSSFSANDLFADLYFNYLRFLNTLLVAKGDAFSLCVEVTGSRGSRGSSGSNPSSRAGGHELRILCKDASQFLGATLNRTHASIGLSATLSPHDFYLDLLGFDRERTSALSVPSPFPAENRCVVVDDRVATTWRLRPENYPRIADGLSRFAEEVPGNCLALFPSYRFLGEVERLINVKGKRVVIQERSSSDQDREQILEALRSTLQGDTLLLAVAGGVFAEGVDYPGNMLRAVAVVGPCLPALNLEQELLKLYFEERFEKGFEYAFVVPGMTRVIQAAGRLIRSPRDSGVIALFDRRFLQGPYCHHLPDDWVPTDGPKGLVGVPQEAAKIFFRNTLG